MRAWAAHAVFAAILLSSIAIRERAADALPDSESLEPAIVRVAGSHGWGLRDFRPTSTMVSRSLVFDAPGCSHPVLVSLLLSTFEEATIMEYAAEPGYMRRYVYFDQTWATPEPWAAYVQRVKYGVLGLFGLTEYAPSQYLLLVETPVHCQAAAAIDWRTVWNPNYRAASQASAEAPTKY